MEGFIDLPHREGEKLLNVKPSSLRRGCNVLEGGIIFDKPKAVYGIKKNGSHQLPS